MQMFRVGNTLADVACAVATTGFGMMVLPTQLTAAEVDKIHFLIPGGAGGGWDGTARGVGEALTKAGLIDQAS